MTNLPIISGKRLLKVLLKIGFVVIRQKGSHVFVEDKTRSLRTVIPIHSNEDLGKGLLRTILNDLNLTVEEFIKLL
ncbi:MAG: type II toxin-antitoxin system HicA family toxin [Patescibacteria group bacterium]